MTSKNSLFPYLLLLAALLVPLFGQGCQTNVTPRAAMFDTLKAAAVGIDAFRASVEAERAAFRVSAEQWEEFAEKYNRANEAIIAGARALRDVGGMESGTPAEVDAAVRALADLVTLLVPPKPR